VWPTVLAECRPTVLSLYHITLSSLEGIERLNTVTRLTLEWATKITDLAPVFELHKLNSLSIFDMPKVRYLDGIEALTGLTELKLSGNQGSGTPHLQLASISSVTKLPGLTRFALLNARLDDDDLTPLVRCGNLKHLHLANMFERAQFAYLAKHLNGQLQEPITAFSGSNVECDTCGADKSMFTGRRMPFLCKTCDAARFDKYRSEFERLVRIA
ncbi:MAG TPA: hypothetical protein VKG92_07225, partial [Flavobacteriales bacterium]|nr:hypothetical protein [Flavobacteriales bacterium]